MSTERIATDRQLIRITTGEDVEDILFDPGKTLLSETLAIEDHYQLTWPQVVVGVNAGRTSAIAAVVWIMRKRKNPKLRPGEVEFSMGELQILDPDFLEEYGGTPLNADDFAEDGIVAEAAAGAPKDLGTPETGSPETPPEAPGQTPTPDGGPA